MKNSAVWIGLLLLAVAAFALYRMFAPAQIPATPSKVLQPGTPASAATAGAVICSKYVCGYICKTLNTITIKGMNYTLCDCTGHPLAVSFKSGIPVCQQQGTRVCINTGKPVCCGG